MRNSSNKRWNLIWSDEFDGEKKSQPDQTKWNIEIGGHGWGNLEWQYYSNDLENLHIDGESHLTITATENREQATELNSWYGVAKYKSARISTKESFQFQYGKAEALMRLPTGQGVWSAFWMLGESIDDVSWPDCGEIDIMENIGREPSTVHASLHGPGYSRVNSLKKHFHLPSGESVSSKFHKFGLEWEPKQIKWFVDGQEVFCVNASQLPIDKTWVFDNPFFMVLNVAVGGIWPGYPSTDTQFPTSMFVDYVRVFKAE